MAYLYDLWIPDPNADKMSRLIKEEPGSVIDTQHKPMAVCVDINQLDVWVANAGANTIYYKNGVRLATGIPAAGTVSRYRDGVHMDDIAVGQTPMAVAVAPDGAIWVANYGSHTVSKIVKNKTVLTLTVGLGPRGICVTPTNIVYVSNYLSSTVTKIVNDTVTASIPVGWNPMGIISDRNSNIYVCCSGSNIVDKIKDTTRVKDITVGRVPYGICLDMSGAIYVTNYYAGTVTKILDDVVTGDPITVGQGPYAIDIDRDNELFVTNYLDGTVSKIVADLEVTTIKVTDSPCGFGDFSGMQAYYTFIYGTGGSGVTKLIGYDDLDPALQRYLDNLKPITLPINASDVTNAGSAVYDTVQKCLDYLMNPAPEITSLTTTISTVYEKGVTINSIPLAWTLNKDVTTQSFGTYGTVPAGTLNTTLTGVNINTDETVKLTVTDAQGNTASKGINFKFQLSNYIGALTNTSVTGTDIVLLRHMLNDSAAMKDQYVNASGGRYIYIAVPAAYALDASHIYIGDRLCTDWVITSVNLTNASGYTSQYTVFRSTRIQTGSNIKIDIIL